MRIREREQTLTRRTYWNVAPARAREVIRENTDSLAETDAMTSAAARPARDSRLEDLRARVKNGSYQVDLEALSRKIVDNHLAGDKR
ncbi:MAG TPA: flagellar biosynthesis anti-sigma factor FlgM [Bryobacteraceae bacterium]|jgi:anti-sigma28 factor (negative regulator of flagellin synthesis)|nr:flagellar biosynthesis anti-sigma factor FlgM [Bryobacteraceae bacterium]